MKVFDNFNVFLTKLMSLFLIKLCLFCRNCPDCPDLLVIKAITCPFQTFFRQKFIFWILFLDVLFVQSHIYPKFDAFVRSNRKLCFIDAIFYFNRNQIPFLKPTNMIENSSFPTPKTFYRFWKLAKIGKNFVI